MIEVTKIGDLAFEVRFDDRVRQDLRDVSGWRSETDAIERILSDILLGYDPCADTDGDLSGDIPF